MIRGRAEKRTDPAVKLADYIHRVQQEEGISQPKASDQKLNGCCHQTVVERCEGCPYATVNS